MWKISHGSLLRKEEINMEKELKEKIINSLKKHTGEDKIIVLFINFT